MTAREKLINWSLFIALSFIWGSSFILMKKGMVDAEGHQIFSPYQVAALRMALAGLVLIPFGLIHRKSIGKDKLIPAVLIGVCGNGIPAFLFTKFFAFNGINSLLGVGGRNRPYTTEADSNMFPYSSTSIFSVCAMRGSTSPQPPPTEGENCLS